MDQRNASTFEIILSIFGILILIFIGSCLGAFVVTKYGYVKSDNGCDGTGWIAYRDDKCYKLVQQSVKYNEAKDICASSRNWFSFDSTIPQMVSIKSADEQDYLTKLVSKLKTNVWIGAILKENKFVWDDDDSQESEYSNWNEENRSYENTNSNCVTMQSDEKWVNVNCEESNYVICEKIQKWSYEKLQKTLLKTRKRLSDAEINLIQTKNELTNVRNNPVPIGFVYVQLPKQPEPSSLWPKNLEWKDVTSEYSGLFFRAEGGDAKAFGEVQEENAPRVTEVKHDGNVHGSVGYGQWGSVVLNVDGWSSGIGVYSGTWSAQPDQTSTTHHFKTSGGEVRPRNMAMRIWKRIY